jgi:hypothetical protein
MSILIINLYTVINNNYYLYSRINAPIDGNNSKINYIKLLFNVVRYKALVSLRLRGLYVVKVV